MKSFKSLESLKVKFIIKESKCLSTLVIHLMSVQIKISTIEPAFKYSEKLGTQRVLECCSEFGSLSYQIGNILEVIDVDKFPLDKDYLEKVQGFCQSVQKILES